MRPRKWFYVQCEEVYVQCEEEPDEVDTEYRMSHTTVFATSKESAYDKGREHFKANPTEESKQGFAFLNDYVIPVNG